MKPYNVNITEVIEYIEDIAGKWETQGLTDGKIAATVIAQGLKRKFVAEVLERTAKEVKLRNLGCEDRAPKHRCNDPDCTGYDPTM